MKPPIPHCRKIPESGIRDKATLARVFQCSALGCKYPARAKTTCSPSDPFISVLLPQQTRAQDLPKIASGAASRRRPRHSRSCICLGTQGRLSPGRGRRGGIPDGRLTHRQQPGAHRGRMRSGTVVLGKATGNGERTAENVQIQLFWAKALPWPAQTGGGRM